MFIEIISYATGVISSYIIENKVITPSLLLFLPINLFMILYILLESLPQFWILFCMKSFFVSFMIWVLLLFSWRYLFLSMLFFVLNHFVLALFLFAKRFFSRFVTHWFLFFFCFISTKAGVCRLQNVNSYKMRWKIDPYCCSEMWLNCFPVPFCIFQTVFCCWRQTYCDVWMLLSWV